MATEIKSMDNLSSNYKNDTELSEIQSFYDGMTVFLTGATGFIGNLILEKLIRTCSGVKRVYILIREKRGKTTEERFKDLFNDAVFELMKKVEPNYLEKISAVIGDCSLPNLGIGEKYQEILKNEVNIVIHSAATVRFDEHLKTAVRTNIMALQDILKLSNEMKNLKSFVHISTAYSNCAGRKVVDEVFYKTPLSGDNLKQLINCLDDEYITRITPSLLKPWPNTYAMTKAVAEGEIMIQGKGLPIGIIRPSMISTTNDEPISGWINNVYGPIGVVAATGMGLMRVMRADPDQIADIVPGDFVSNAVLACAWDIHKQWKEHKHSNSIIQDQSLEQEHFNPPIYNFVSSCTKPLTWLDFKRYNKKHEELEPSQVAIWPIMVCISKNKYEYNILCFLVHTVPAYIIDTIAQLTGRKPRLVDGYRKLHKFTDVVSYFSLQSWTFHDKNTRSLVQKLSKTDQVLFKFDMAKLDWDQYFNKSVYGVRKYLLKETASYEERLRHQRKLYTAHYTLLIVLAALFLLIIYGLFLLFL